MARPDLETWLVTQQNPNQITRVTLTDQDITPEEARILGERLQSANNLVDMSMGYDFPDSRIIERLRDICGMNTETARACIMKMKDKEILPSLGDRDFKMIRDKVPSLIAVARKQFHMSDREIRKMLEAAQREAKRFGVEITIPDKLAVMVIERGRVEMEEEAPGLAAQR